MPRLFPFFLTQLFLLGLIGLPLGSALHAQANIPVSEPVDFITKFQDIHVDAAGTGYAVGTCGVIRKTVTDGQMWDDFPSPTADNVESVACPPGGCATALIVGTEGLFRLSNDKWTDVTFPDFAADGQLHWLTEEVVILETGGDHYYRSADGGLNWTKLELADFQRGNMVFLDGTTGYLFVATELFKTTDGGATYVSVGYNHPDDVRATTWLDADKGWLFDSKRLFYHTTDGGKTWALLNAESQLNSVNWFAALSATHLVGAQVTTNRLESLDGGVTWSRGSFLTDGNERVNEKYHRRGNEFFTVGDASQLLYSAGGFTDFVELDPFTRWPRVRAFAFPMDDVGHVLTRFQLHSTSDAGLTWKTTDLPQQSFEMGTLNNGDVFLLSSQRSMISRDGGTTIEDWIPGSVLPDNEQPYRYARKPGGELYLYGSNKSLVTADEGENFTVIEHNTDRSPTAMHFVTDMVGYFVTNRNEVGKTTDGGLTWAISEGPANNLVDVHFFTADKGIATTASTLYRTEDGGATWGRGAFREGGYSITVHPTDGSLLMARYLSGNNGSIARSTDDGATWTQLNFNCYAYRAGGLTPNGKFFWTGGDGGFWVRHDLDALVASTAVRPRSRRAYKQLSAFPNPTRDRVRILVPVTRSGPAELSVFSLDGKALGTYPVARGADRVEIDLTPFPAGVYVLQWAGGQRNGRVKVVRR